MAGLTADDINRVRSAAGAYGGIVIPAGKIADLFNDAMTKHGDGWFTNKKRVAALVSECLMESAYFRTTVEYASTGPYQPYRGRTFIQLTWKSNYQKFGKWCKARGLVKDANYFVKNPVALGQAQWAALGGVFYFTQVKWGGKNLCQIADGGSPLAIGRAVNLGNPWSSATPNGQSARNHAWDLVMSLDSSIVPHKAATKKKKAKKKVAPAATGDKMTLHVVRGPVKAYDGTGRYRSGHNLKKGAKKAGQVAKNPFGDGRYFVVGKKPHRFFYPLDSGNWSHSAGGSAIGVTPKKAAPKAKTHVVKSGENLTVIAKAYGTTVAKIVRDNNIKDPDLIRAGQKLTIK